MRRRAQGGWTIAEAVAGLALITVGLTASFGVLVGVRGAERRLADATVRSGVAQDVLERTLALPFGERRSASMAIPPHRVDGRDGWRVQVRVSPEAPGLEQIEVTVSGAGRSTRLRTLATAWRQEP